MILKSSDTLEEKGKEIGMENLDIRILTKSSGLMYKDVASRMGISKEYLSRVLRYPLKPKTKERIMTALYELRGESR